MERYYQFAGVELAVTPPAGTDFFDDRNLASFRVSAVTDPHRFVFAFKDTLTPPEGELLAQLPDYTVYGYGDTQIRYMGTVGGDWNRAIMRCEHRGKTHVAELRQDAFPGGMTAKTLLNACAAEHLAAAADGFVLHAAYVAYEGGAILFTAPSGTGKSTQAELWRNYRNAEIINGDRAVVRMDAGRALAEGIPFPGSSQICQNRSLPLRAIVYLSQAPQTTICQLQGAQAFARVWEGISVNIWDRQDVALVSETVQTLLEQVPVYHLACTPDESAVIALEQLLRKRE